MLLICRHHSQLQGMQPMQGRTTNGSVRRQDGLTVPVISLTLALGASFGSVESEPWPKRR